VTGACVKGDPAGAGHESSPAADRLGTAAGLFCEAAATPP